MGCHGNLYLDQCFFLFYINDLPKVVNYNSKPILFIDDISIIVSNPNLVNFKSNLIFSFKQFNEWFNINLSSLKYNKTRYIQFRTTNSQAIQLDISYNNRCIVNNINIQFQVILLIASCQRSIILMNLWLN
jgi:hypothetical protein